MDHIISKPIESASDSILNPPQQDKFLKLDLLTDGRLAVHVMDGSNVKHEYRSMQKFPVRAREWNYVGFTFDGEINVQIHSIWCIWDIVIFC